MFGAVVTTMIRKKNCDKKEKRETKGEKREEVGNIIVFIIVPMNYILFSMY